MGTDPRLLGDKIEGSGYTLGKIVDVNPARFNGIEGCLVVCGQKEAEYMCIHAFTTENEEINILLPCSKDEVCKDTYLLADAIID